MGTDIHGVMQSKVNSKWANIPHNYLKDRHYMLFAWLADVRNGYGFAGVSTHGPLTPISPPRGLPEDFEIIGDMGDHSYSWLTADEILSAPLPRITRTGVVGLSEYKDLNGRTPTSWCGWLSGLDIVVSDARNITPETTHVQISWEVECCEEFAYFIDEIRRLKEEHGEVRFVFGFDS